MNGPRQIKRHHRLASAPKPHKSLTILGIYRVLSILCTQLLKIAQLLLDLTKKNLVWRWERPQHDAFEELKTRMCCSLVLTQLDFEGKFYLQTDALAYSVGTVLSQRGKNLPSLQKHAKPKTHPIAYYSATFTPIKQNYNIYEWELLAIMKSLAHWRPYLGWTKEPFTILTDHANL
jgi:hypothetical protein